MEYNFSPSFKENEEGQQFIYRNQTWVECDEDLIDSLWKNWVSAPKAYKTMDEEGFVVFGYKN